MKAKTASANANQIIFWSNLQKLVEKKFILTSAHRKAIYKIGAVVLVLGLLTSGAFAYQKVYQGKIYPKIIVAGIKVGGLEVLEAKNKIIAKTQELNEQGPEITYNEETLKPKLDEMGVGFNVDEVIKKAANFGRQGSLGQKIKENWQILFTGYQAEISPQIDEEKFNAYLSQLAIVVEKEPVNASLAINKGEVILSSAELGRGLDKEKIKNDLKTLINSGQTNGKITLLTSDLEAAIEEEQTTDARLQAEKFMNAAPMTVTFEASSWTADRFEIGSWIKFISQSNDKLVASASPDGFVSWVEKQVEIPAKDREVEDGTGTVLNEGQDGRGADTNTLIAQIREALKAGKAGSSFALLTFAIPRGQTIIYPHAQPGRYGSRYIDINLSEQTLYAFEGPTLVNQFLVSTGKGGYATPTGEFAIYGKDRYALMDGPDYYLPNVPFVSWFLGDYSIHGTYWHSNFGHTMSHGCVNASTGDAEWLFGWADIGTPVYVHY